MVERFKGREPADVSTRNRRAVATFVACLCWAALAAVFLPGAPDAQEVRFLRIGTGATGGTYFPVGGLIANAISNPPGSMACDTGGSCGVKGVVAAAVSTEGSVENATRVASGALDLALSQADVAFFAHSGTGAFRGKPAMTNLRAIGSLYPEQLHVVVRADAGIETIGQMRGQPISLGQPNSGTLVAAKQVLGAYGLGVKALQARYETVDQSTDLLIDGAIDGYFMMGGYPLNAVRQAAERVDVALLPVDGPGLREVLARHAFFTPARIPDGVYPGTSAVETLAVEAQLIVAAEMDEELVYEITRALWNPRNRKILDSGHPNGRRIRRENALDGIAIPLHPGAARFYEENGLGAAAGGASEAGGDAPTPAGTE
jgi:TRAP transporter TAXI family solute receptor